MKNKATLRAACVAAAVGTLVVGVSGATSGTADAGPLPGGYLTKTLVDGTRVNVRLSDEFVNVQRAVTNVPTSREVWLSGKVRVDVDGEAIEYTGIYGGYLVGCQLNFGAGAGGEAGAAFNGAAQTITPSGTANGGFTLGPGEAKFVPVISATSGLDRSYKYYDVVNYTFTGPTGGMSYTQQRFGLDGCAGYAQAKAMIQVTVNTESVKGSVTLYGKPFSLG